MLVEEFAFPSAVGDPIRVRIDGQGPPSHEQSVRGRLALRELRFALAQNLEPTLAALRRFYEALFQHELDVRSRLLDSTQIEALLEAIERQFELGRLVVVEGALPLLGIRQEIEFVQRERPPIEVPPLPPITRPAIPDKLTFFEVRFVDEIGQGIGGLEVELVAGSDKEKLKTNPGGVAILEDVTSMSANVSVVSSTELSNLLDPRWKRPRPGSAPSGVNTRSLTFAEQRIAGLDLKPAVPNTVVLTPPLGELFVELFDKTGRVRHTAQKYDISGPASFSGETDEDGRLQHANVFPGDYLLELTVEVDPGDGSTVSDKYQAPLIVLNPGSEPQVRKLGVVPYVAMARMRGLLFDTNKCFLLPTALDALKQIREIYLSNNPSELLIIGHTDTTAQPDINDPLSKERADSVKAYLQDAVDVWLGNYDLDGKKRWGSREDRLMISALPDFGSRGEDEDIVEWFQRTRSLTVDGVAGPQTRRQLVTEYMQLDGVKLSEESGLHISIQTHGAGENFPLAGTGFELDKNAADEKEDAFDRRVELFFFDVEFGVLPAPGAPDGPEYLQWRERAAENHDFPIEGIGKEATVVEFEDALFRTNSCVVLPEAEAPSGDEHASISSVGLVATTLRFAEENPKKKLFIAGHTDTTASVDFNQKLSEERARCVLALLEGNRAEFVTLVDQRHTVADLKQILSWCSQAFTDLEFDCDPGPIDDNAFTGIEPLKRFQTAYNENKAALGASSQPDLAVDGDIGPLTWGAIFDIYEFALIDELGENRARLATLRAKLVFVDGERKALGFSEHHPVDQIGRDGVRSQENRRSEVLFFDPGEEPDLVLAESDPDISEVYLPGAFEHVTLPPMPSAKPWKARWAESTANIDKPGRLLLTAPGLPAGTDVIFEITGPVTETVVVRSTTSAAGQAELEFDEWDLLLEGVEPRRFGAGESFTAMKFTFVAQAGGRSTTAANQVTYADRVEQRLRFDLNEEDTVDADDMKYTLVTLLGSRPGTTREVDGVLGFLVEEDLPPGGFVTVVEDLTALGGQRGRQAI